VASVSLMIKGVAAHGQLSSKVCDKLDFNNFFL
jgi:hypothetical protein